jgi:hypothetical protein
MPSLTDASNPKSLSNLFRRQRDVALREMIADISAESGCISILDIGGTSIYWERVGMEFLSQVNASVTVLNLPGVLSTTENSNILQNVTGNACDLSAYEDKYFDLSHSNSVIEHVGSWESMKSFAREAVRVSRYYYIQTPYFWFPFDPHFFQMPFFHWLPRPIKVSLLRSFPIGHAGRASDLNRAHRVAESSSLLDRQQMAFLFRGAEIQFERFYGFQKSIVARSPMRIKRRLRDNPSLIPSTAS